MRSALFVTAMIVLMTTRMAWAEGVQTTWSCSKVKDQKTCSFDITIRGEIISGILEDMKKALIDRQEMLAREGGSNDWWLVHVDSPGGNVQAAFDIGRLLRSVDAPVDVGANQQCVSACVLILAGATHRNIIGRVGIHRPYFETPTSEVDFKKVQSAYSAMTEQIRSYFREMNISERLADDMMIVGPERVRFLSSAELASYGLGIVDPVASEEAELKEAKKLGIDRREYMRRKALSNTFCLIPTGSGDPGWDIVSQACTDAVLAGKHVEKAPPCRPVSSSISSDNPFRDLIPRPVTCHPWEREWNGKKLDAGELVSDDGFVISNGK
jgi:ATP-dependent protease ClpP protease subunit